MDYVHSDYGFVGDLGYFFIPSIMQKESKIKKSTNDQVTLVECGFDDDHITVKYHKTMPYAEYKTIQANKPKEIRVIDDFGRVNLPKSHLEKLKISPYDVAVSFLLSDGTIKIRPLVVSRTFAAETE